VFAAVATAGCGTVDPGPPTGPPAGCNAAPALFVQRVWPEYLERYGCAAASCHDAASGHGAYRLQPVADSPAFDARQPSTMWPPAWRENLVASSRLLNCADPGSSLLLVGAEGRSRPHPPGNVVTDHDGALALLRAWAAAR
jgi:hypothetical protein